MFIYFLLIIYILLCPHIINYYIPNIEKQQSKILGTSLFAIFLLLALKAPSVGRDTLGYKKMYESFAYASWNNYNLYWTESGFEFLEMFFTHILKFDFQAFAATLYAFICFSYYIFLKKYSEDVMFSLLIYVCFGFIVFDLSGIRFSTSLAISLFAFPFAQKKGIRYFIAYFLIILLASQIHRGAYFCFFLYFVIHITTKGWQKLLYISFPAFLVVGLPLLNILLRPFSRKTFSIGIFIGGSVIFYIGVLALIFIENLLLRSQPQYTNDMAEYISVFDNEDLATMTRLFYIGIVLVIALGEQTIVRTANYSLFFITALLPNAVKLMNNKSKFVMKTILIVFFISFFYIFKIMTNDLYMLPYIPFWQQ